MKSLELERTANSHLDTLAGLPVPPTTGKRMYALSFDLDQDALRRAYPGNSHNNAYLEVRRVLVDEGFLWMQGSVYFGGERINAVTCVLAAQRLARDLAWFSASVRDIRMLRIEDNNDLGPAVGITKAVAPDVLSSKTVPLPLAPPKVVVRTGRRSRR